MTAVAAGRRRDSLLLIGSRVRGVAQSSSAPTDFPSSQSSRSGQYRHPWASCPGQIGAGCPGIPNHVNQLAELAGHFLHVGRGGHRSIPLPRPHRYRFDVCRQLSAFEHPQEGIEQQLILRVAELARLPVNQAEPAEVFPVNGIDGAHQIDSSGHLGLDAVLGPFESLSGQSGEALVQAVGPLR